jgi:hypothetical protein
VRGEDEPEYVPGESRTRAGELAHLKRQARYFKDVLGNVEERIAELRRDTGQTTRGPQEATDQEE